MPYLAFINYSIPPIKLMGIRGDGDKTRQGNPRRTLFLKCRVAAGLLFNLLGAVYFSIRKETFARTR